MVTIGDSGNIGANGTNDDLMETMIVHWSYNGTSGDNNAHRDNGVNGENNSYGDGGNIGTNEANDDPFETMMIHWLCNGANEDNRTNGDNCVKGENNSNSDGQ